MTLKLNGTNSEAAPAYAGDDADTGLQCGTDELKLVTGGTARATVDDAGRVLVGTASTYDGEASNLIVASSGHTGITVASTGSNQRTNLYFADGTSGTAAYVGGFTYDHNDNSLLMRTASTERMRILSDGTIRLASGCPGIDFSQIQTNTSGMTSETLDSYEEGTFDAFSSVADRFTGESTRCSRYTRIGNLVRCDLRVQWTGTINTSAAVAFDLPFAEAGTTGGGTAATGNTGIAFYQGTSVDSSPVSTHVPRNGSLVSFYVANGGSSFDSVKYNNVNGTYDWLVSFSYFCA
jgi:hypothetical protein